MKNNRLMLALMFVPLFALAQNMPPFDPSKMPSNMDMQKMMVEAKKMQTCMAQVDQAELEALGRRGQALSDQIDKLCAQGKSDEALQLAIDFSTEVNGNESVQTVRECSKGMADMLPQMGLGDFAGERAEDDDDICSSGR